MATMHRTVSDSGAGGIALDVLRCAYSATRMIRNLSAPRNAGSHSSTRSVRLTISSRRAFGSKHSGEIAPGQYSIRINDQWRVCSRLQDGDATDVEIVDYH